MDLNFLRKQNYMKGKSSSLVPSNIASKDQQKQVKLLKNTEKTIQSFLAKNDVTSLDKTKNNKIVPKVQTTPIIKPENENVNKVYLKHNNKSQLDNNEGKILSVSMNSIESQKKSKTKINDVYPSEQQRKKNRSSVGYKMNLNSHYQKSKQNDPKQLHKEELPNDSLKIKQKNLQISKKYHERETLISRLNIEHKVDKDPELKLTNKESQLNCKKSTKQSQLPHQQISIKKIELYVDNKNKNSLPPRSNNVYKKQIDKNVKSQNKKQVEELLALNLKLTQNLRISQQKLKDKEAEQKMVTSQNIYLRQQYEKLQKQLNLKIQQMSLKINTLNEQNTMIKLQILQNNQQKTNVQQQLQTNLQQMQKKYNQYKSNYEKLENNYTFLENDQQLKINQQQYNIMTKDQQILMQSKSIKELQQKCIKYQQELNSLKKQKITLVNESTLLKNDFEQKINTIKLQSHKRNEQSLQQNIVLKKQIGQLNLQKNILEQKYKKMESTMIQQTQKYKQQLMIFLEVKKKYELEIKSKENLLTEIIKLQSLRMEQYEEKCNVKIKQLLNEIQRLEQELEKSYYQKSDLENQYDHLYKSFLDQQQAYDKLSEQQDKNLEKLEILTVQLQKKENYIQQLNLQLEQSEQIKNMLSNKINSSECELCNQLAKELNKITSEFQTYKYENEMKLDRFEDQNDELRNMLKMSKVLGVHSADIMNQ